MTKKKKVFTLGVTNFREFCSVRRFNTPKQSRYRFAAHNGYRAGQLYKGLKSKTSRLKRDVW